MKTRSRAPWWLVVVGIIVGLWLVAPVFIVIPLSFTGKSSFEFPPQEWSLQNYANFFTNPAWRDALFVSLRLALVVAVLAVIVGTLASFAIVRGNFRGRGALTGLVLAPMVAPVIVIGIGVLGLFLSWKLTGNFLGYVLAHTMLAVPFVVVTVSTSLGGFDRNLERAAISLGASPLRAAWRVTLPLILPGMLAGALFAFVTSFDEVVIALYLSSPTFTTLSVQMYTSVTSEVDPTIAAASSLILVVTTALILIPVFARRNRHAR